MQNDRPRSLGSEPLCAAAEMCNIMHADGAGTKSALAYMYWKETGDLSVWKVRASLSRRGPYPRS